ncbi:hypothetical protein OUZ56_032670, partial [Daphnia magna]
RPIFRRKSRRRGAVIRETSRGGSGYWRRIRIPARRPMREIWRACSAIDDGGRLGDGEAIDCRNAGLSEGLPSSVGGGEGRQTARNVPRGDGENAFHLRLPA